MAVKDLEAPRSRMVIRAEDFSTWIVDDVEWNWGLEANFYETPLTKVQSSANGIIATSLLSHGKIDFSDIEKEKEKGKIWIKCIYFIIFPFLLPVVCFTVLAVINAVLLL